MPLTDRHVLFVFLDGIGLGSPGDNNPFSFLSLPGHTRWTDDQAWTSDAHRIHRPDHVFRPVDATLGVDGLPQSGTGQASLFSGVNSAELAGRHFGPYPHSKTKSVLAERSLFRRVQALGRSTENEGETAEENPAAFANAYPDEFFQHREKTGRWTVTTFCCINAGIHLRRYGDWLNGHAVTADLTGRAWRRELGYELEPISESDAADRLVRLTHEYRLTVFEYYLTDKAGHSGNRRRARPILFSVDRLLEALHERLDFDRHLFVLSSDHGNLEDLSTTGHTRNPVPLLARGSGADAFQEAASILDVTPGIISALGGHAEV